MNNTGAGIVFSTSLVLGTIYGFEWYHIFMIILASLSWLIITDVKLVKEYRELINKKLTLEIILLEKKALYKSKK